MFQRYCNLQLTPHRRREYDQNFDCQVQEKCEFVPVWFQAKLFVLLALSRDSLTRYCNLFRAYEIKISTFSRSACGCKFFIYIFLQFPRYLKFSLNCLYKNAYKLLYADFTESCQRQCKSVSGNGVGDVNGFLKPARIDSVQLYSVQGLS